MPASTARQVVVDDEDPRIQYTSGQWQVLPSNKWDAQGNSGPTLFSTLHEGQSNGTFTFNFAGTAIDVFGTTAGTKTSRSWQCSVDGYGIDAQAPPSQQGLENNSLLCSAENLPDTPHNLTVTVDADAQHHFFFDYLRYTPSNVEDFEDALVFIPFSDPDIMYRGNWNEFVNATAAETKGASASIRFTGISVQWFGALSSEFPTGDSQASYSIDDGPANPLTIAWPDNGQGTQMNQRVFDTPVLPFALHNLTVEFDSVGTTSVPLTLAYLLVQNSTSVSPAVPSASSSSATTNSSSSMYGAGKKVDIAAVVGGLLGSLLFLCILVSIWFWYRRRRNAKWGRIVSNPFNRQRSIPQPIETDSISTLNLFGSPSEPQLPVRRPESRQLDKEPQASGSRPGVRNSIFTTHPANLDENASYYGGYQTWGQAKALEAAAGSRQRDSYI